MELTFNLNEHKNFSSLEESVSVLSGKFMQIFNVAVFIRQIQSYYKAKKHKSNMQLILNVQNNNICTLEQYIEIT